MNINFTDITATTDAVVELRRLSDEYFSAISSLLSDSPSYFCVSIPTKEVILEVDPGGREASVIVKNIRTSEPIAGFALDDWLNDDSDAVETIGFSFDDLVDYLLDQSSLRMAVADVLETVSSATEIHLSTLRDIVKANSDSMGESTTQLLSLLGAAQDDSGALSIAGASSVLSRILSDSLSAYEDAEGDYPGVDYESPTSIPDLLSGIVTTVVPAVGQLLLIAGGPILKVIGAAMTLVGVAVSAFAEDAVHTTADINAPNRLVRGSFQAVDGLRVSGIANDTESIQFWNANEFVGYCWPTSPTPGALTDVRTYRFNSYLNVCHTWSQMVTDLPSMREVFLNHSGIDVISETTNLGDTMLTIRPRPMEYPTLRTATLLGHFSSNHDDGLAGLGEAPDHDVLQRNIIATLWYSTICHSLMTSTDGYYYRWQQRNFIYPVDVRNPDTDEEAMNVVACFVNACWQAYILNDVRILEEWAVDDDDFLKLMRAYSLMMRATNTDTPIARFSKYYWYVKTFAYGVSGPTQITMTIPLVNPFFADQFINAAGSTGDSISFMNPVVNAGPRLNVGRVPTARCYNLPDVSVSEVLAVVLATAALVTATFFLVRAGQNRLQLRRARKLQARRDAVESRYANRLNSPADYREYTKACRKYNRLAARLGVPQVNPLTGTSALVSNVAGQSTYVDVESILNEIGNVSSLITGTPV